MKIKDYTLSSANAGDKITVSDATTGATKNVTVESLVSFTGLSTYKSFLSQASAAAPTAVEFDTNTITGTWSYISAGVYRFTSTGSFTSDYISFNFTTPTDQEYTFEATKVSANIIQIITYLNGTPADDILANQYFDIQVYTL